ncbi:IclR family transcriptional regulator [Variovorax sp. GT1P44]|uniref:IclR family transcriptional regulator n=1 Tax=Variovorax sp. GT1P44 TaxID=3443742 RepID=UPI003F4462B7
MSVALDRGMQILELLADSNDGMSLASIADAVDVPKSACHRLLEALAQRGYVRQIRERGDYVMTTKLPALGLSFLSSSGLVDIAQPMIERLADMSGELARLSIVDQDRLTWVAKAEGNRKGFRYDPDMGMNARLSCTSSGHAWLMTMSDELAVALVSKQGFGKPEDYGPKAPTTVKALLGFLHAARVRGYAMIDEVFAPGMTAVAAPVCRPNHPPIGVISLAGPRNRLTFERMQQLGPVLLDTARELATLSNASGLFSKPPLGKA